MKTNGVDTGKVITAQPIPEDPSETEPIEEKKRSNMVGRGEYVYTPKATTARYGMAYPWRGGRAVEALAPGSIKGAAKN